MEVIREYNLEVLLEDGEITIKQIDAHLAHLVSADKVTEFINRIMPDTIKDSKDGHRRCRLRGFVTLLKLKGKEVLEGWMTEYLVMDEEDDEPYEDEDLYEDWWDGDDTFVEFEYE